jgi:hypothetical protein
MCDALIEVRRTSFQNLAGLSGPLEILQSQWPIYKSQCGFICSDVEAAAEWARMTIEINIDSGIHPLIDRGAYRAMIGRYNNGDNAGSDG